MKDVYAVTFENVAVTAAQDLVSILSADDRPVELLYCEIGNLTELGDTAEEELRIAIVRGNTTVGSGGSAFTPLALKEGGLAAGASCRINDSTAASVGTPVNLYAGAWNIRMPFIWDATPERFITVRGTSFLCLRLLAAPADSITMSGTVYFSEG